MGTRGLTVVVMDGKHRVAQYGQWDHYPTGQGTTALTFCRKHLATDKGRKKFKKAVGKVRFIDDAKLDALYLEVGVDLKKSNGMVPCDKSDEFNEKYPHLHRNCGAEVLDAVLNGATDLQDSLEFGTGDGGGFSCEGIYLVNLDKNVLEVYYGSQMPSQHQGTMHRLIEEQETAVPLVATFDLDNIRSKANAEEVMERLQKMVKLTSYPECRKPEDDEIPSIVGKIPYEVANLAMEVETSLQDKSIHRIEQCAPLYEDSLDEDPDTLIKDMLADLRHVCSVKGLDFSALSRISLKYFKDELAEDNAS